MPDVTNGSRAWPLIVAASLLCEFGCTRLQRDEDIRSEFERHRPGFERIAELMARNPDIIHVSVGEVRGVRQETIQRVSEELRELPELASRLRVGVFRAEEDLLRHGYRRNAVALSTKGSRVPRDSASHHS